MKTKYLIYRNVKGGYELLLRDDRGLMEHVETYSTIIEALNATEEATK